MQWLRALLLSCLHPLQGIATLSFPGRIPCKGLRQCRFLNASLPFCTQISSFAPSQRNWVARALQDEEEQVWAVCGGLRLCVCNVVSGGDMRPWGPGM